MSGDLVSLQMVAVLAAATEQELWRQGAGLSVSRWNCSPIARRRERPCLAKAASTFA